MIIEVFHKIDPCFYHNYSFDEVIKVAHFDIFEGVDHDALEKAFFLTNHIDSDWTSRDGKSCGHFRNFQVHNGEHGHRSTSVGDFASCTDSSGTRMYHCNMIGWVQIDNQPKQISTEREIDFLVNFEDSKVNRWTMGSNGFLS